MGRELDRLVVAAHPETLRRLEPALADVLAATRSRAHRLDSDADLEPGAFEIREIEFAPHPER